MDTPCTHTRSSFGSPSLLHSPMSWATPSSGGLPDTPVLEVDMDTVPFSESFSGMMHPHFKLSDPNRPQHSGTTATKPRRKSIPADSSFQIKRITNVKDMGPEWQDDDIAEIVVLSPKTPAPAYALHQQWSPLPERTSVAGFDLLRIIDIDSTAQAFLARSDGDGKIYVIKSMRKSALKTASSIKRVRAEQYCLKTATMLESAFLPRLHRSFHDNERLQLVLDFYSGGDLLTYLLGNGQLRPEECLFYASEIICAVWQLHSIGIVHRSVRPENVCISSDGHIVLSNFRHAKMLHTTYDGSRCRTSSNCGSRDYQAPEMILGWHYDFSVDCWGFGVLLFLLHFGHHPFVDGSEMDPLALMQNELSRGTALAKDAQCVSPAAWDLIMKCLERNPLLRVNIEQIKEHEYFQSIDWLRVASKGYEAPYVPGSKSGMDLTRFDEALGLATSGLEQGGHRPGLNDDMFDDYSFVWESRTSRSGLYAEKLLRSSTAIRPLGYPGSHSFLSSDPTVHPAHALRNVRSILKQPSRRFAGDQEILDSSLRAQDMPTLRHSVSLFSIFDAPEQSRKLRKKRSSMPPTTGRSSVYSNRHSASTLFGESTPQKDARNKLRKKSRNSICAPLQNLSGVSAATLPTGITQSGRGIGYTYTPPASRSRISLSTLGAQNCFGRLGLRLGAKNKSKENLPKSRGDVMQQIYGSSWSVAHMNEAMMSTPTFGIPEGLGRRASSIDLAHPVPPLPQDAHLLTNAQPNAIAI